MKNRNIKFVVEEKLCTSCGVCSVACPRQCITIKNTSQNCVPVVDENVCTACGICVKACPGHGINLVEMTRQQFGQEIGIEKNDYAGYYNESMVGYSMDNNLRYHSASGGLVTTFLLYLLEKKYIDGALVLGYKNSNVFEPYSYIATTREQILSSRGSKYVVSSISNALNNLKAFNGKVAVVGLPCQIQGVKKLLSFNNLIKSKIFGCFSIYCSLNKTRNSIEYYLDHYKINKKNVAHFSFRDDGCMGFMKYTGIDGEVIKKIPYVSYWHGTHSFFTNERCTVCIDHFGELADISFGDINIKPYNEDKIGISSIVVRSKFWLDILKKAVDDHYIHLKHIPIEDICKSQIYAQYYKKGAGVEVNKLLRRIRGLSNPHYDYIYKGSISPFTFVKELSNLFMRVIGSHKSLWFIVHLLDRNK